MRATPRLAATGRPPPDEPLSLRTLSKDGVRAVRSAVQRLTLFSLLYVPLFFLSLVPVVGLVGLAGTLIYSAFFLALNFTDPVLERRKLPLPRKVGWASGVAARAALHHGRAGGVAGGDAERGGPGRSGGVADSAE